MSKQIRTNNYFLSTTAVLAAGVLSGCQYCEPLLMAMLVIGALVISTTRKGLACSVSAEQ